MKDADTKAEFSYTLSRWLSKDMEGCDSVVEIPAIWPERPLPQGKAIKPKPIPKTVHN